MAQDIPRALNVPVGFTPSSFIQRSEALNCALRRLARMSGVIPSPAVANGVVYVGSEDGLVYALNAATGTELWSFTTGQIVLSSPAVAMQKAPNILHTWMAIDPIPEPPPRTNTVSPGCNTLI